MLCWLQIKSPIFYFQSVNEEMIYYKFRLSRLNDARSPRNNTDTRDDDDKDG